MFQYYFLDMLILFTMKYHLILVNIFCSNLHNRGSPVGGYLLPQKSSDLIYDKRLQWKL